MKTRKQFIGMAIAIITIAIIGIAFIGCKDEPDEPPPPQPVAQSKTFSKTTINGTVNITVNYTALPNTIPAWWGTLESVFEDRAEALSPSNLILNVKTTGTDGFVAGEAGSKTATVSEAFLSTSDYATMRASMGPIGNQWIAGYSTPRTLSFGTPACQVTIKSDDTFLTAEWTALCDKTVAAINDGYAKGNTARFEEVFASDWGAVVILGSNFTYNWEVKDGEFKSVYVKIASIETVDFNAIILRMKNSVVGKDPTD